MQPNHRTRFIYVRGLRGPVMEKLTADVITGATVGKIVRAERRAR